MWTRARTKQGPHLSFTTFSLIAVGNQQKKLVSFTTELHSAWLRTQEKLKEDICQDLEKLQDWILFHAYWVSKYISDIMYK